MYQPYIFTISVIDVKYGFPTWFDSSNAPCLSLLIPVEFTVERYNMVLLTPLYEVIGKEGVEV